MVEFLLSPAVVPFSGALALLVGLLLLECVALVVGGSLLGKSLDDIDPGAGFDAGAAEMLALPANIDIHQIDLGGIDPGDLDITDLPPATGTLQGHGLAGMLGLGKVPFVIWLAAVLAGFGVSGYLVQSVALHSFGAALPVFAAMLPAGLVGVWFARGYGQLLARLVPKTESSVYSDAMLNRRRGTVSQGTARRDSPAEVRVTDAYGNLHFIRAEPLDANDAIPAGTDVLVLRIRLGPDRGKFRILALSQS